MSFLDRSFFCPLLLGTMQLADVKVNVQFGVLR